jgi:hypothetical protein
MIRAQGTGASLVANPAATSLPIRPGLTGISRFGQKDGSPYMGALGDDVPMQLLGNGAQILSQNGNPRDGFRFEYKICKSVGTLAILPLAINSGVYRLSPLPKGLLDVTARIELMETWFPKTPGVITMGRQ